MPESAPILALMSLAPEFVLIVLRIVTTISTIPIMIINFVDISFWFIVVIERLFFPLTAL